jgi:hypothetical protein
MVQSERRLENRRERTHHATNCTGTSDNRSAWFKQNKAANREPAKAFEAARVRRENLSTGRRLLQISNEAGPTNREFDNAKTDKVCRARSLVATQHAA